MVEFDRCASRREQRILSTMERATLDRELLDLAAAGHSREEIAQRLELDVASVRSRLEHLTEKDDGLERNLPGTPEERAQEYRDFIAGRPKTFDRLAR